jgi:hypothetical protein
MTKPIGLIIDQGNSPIDGKPYVAIATLKSKNSKTGDMIQVWIIRSDVSPLDAIASGQDYSICGNCPHRGVIGNIVSADQKIERSCYVNVGREVMAIWKAYQAKKYHGTYWPETVTAMFKGRRIRWGAYGDPSIINPDVVSYLNGLADGHTGYTHQWKSDFAQVFKGVFQASCDGLQDYLDASAHGWKCFSVVAAGQESIGWDIGKTCPATVENSEAKCLTCRLCDGAKQDIKVEAHGKGKKYVGTFK